MPTFAEQCLVDSIAAEVNLETLNPTSQNTYQLADIVTLMNCKLSLGIVPLLKKTQQNYFVYNVDVLETPCAMWCWSTPPVTRLP